MKAALIALAIIAAAPASAADFCVRIASPSFNRERCGSVPDAMVPAFFEAYAPVYGTVAIPEVKDAEGNVTAPASTRPATQAEQFDAFANGIGRGISDQVRAHLMAKAAEAARAAVPEVGITPR